MTTLDELLEAAEPNPLLQRVDGLCASREWDGLAELALRCRQATERGKQLWPIAEYIEYRLALEAPGRWAASVLGPDAGRFASGPLTEVAASTHTFGELAPHITSPQVAGMVAAERVLRGEDLTSHEKAHPEVLELPLVLQAWEPEYPLATYRGDKATFAEPPDPLGKRRPATPGPTKPLEDAALEAAMMDLVTPWLSESNGAASFRLVEGHAEGLVAEMGGAVIMDLSVEEALAHVAWAAASGGAHGRRRGAAFGRFSAWWVSAELVDLSWPVYPDELEARVTSLEWFLWEPEMMKPGWNLHIAVRDPEEGWTAALSASDLVHEEDEVADRA